MPSKTLIKLSDNDAFLGSVLKQDLSMFAAMEPPQVLADLRECVSVLVRGEHVLGAVGLRLGAALARVVKDRLWVGYGYQSANAFEVAELLNRGAGHSTIWKYKRIHEAFPALAPDRCIAIGPNKLTTAARACNECTSQAQKEKLLERALESPSAEQFREYVEGESGMSAPGATTGASFQLFGTKEQIDEFKEWLADGRFREFAGVDTPIGMVLAAIEEASSVFPVERPKNDKRLHMNTPPIIEPAVTTIEEAEF